MSPTYADLLSPKAKKVLSTHYGETGLKYAGVAEWSLWFKMLWLYFTTKLSPPEVMYRVGHLLQIHYGVWDSPTIQSFTQSVSRATDLAFQALKIPKKKPATLLHAGCGWGGTEFQLVRQNSDLKTIGISIEQQQITMARRFAELYQLNTRSTFEQANFLRLPKKWNSKFEGCLALESLCYVPEHQLGKLFPSLFRVLKPKARLVVHDWYLTKTDLSVKEQAMLEVFQKGWDMPATVSLKTFQTEAKKAGFRHIKSKKLTSQILKSARAIYWRATLFSPVIKLFQNNQHPRIKALGLTHPQLLDFLVTCRVQKHLFERGIIDYYQVVLEK